MREKARRYATRSRGNETLAAFIRLMQADYQFGWFSLNICARLDKFLDDVINKRSPRLMLFAPPRHGKSQIVSRMFPAYAQGRYPDLQIIATSYAAELASKTNREVQRIFDEPAYQMLFPETRLPSAGDRAYVRNSDIFEIVGKRGVYRSAGVGGGITGMGGDALIIDDPIKDAADAASAVYRETLWEWYQSVLYTRRQPGAGIVLVMTRWHQSDLAGRLLEAMKNGADQWDVVSYPAIAEHDEEFRKEGEALHPERHSLESLLATQRGMTAYAWASLFQQRPVPREGGMFKLAWFADKIIDPAAVPTTGVYWWRHWDLAATKSKDAARTAGVLMGKTRDGRFIVRDVKLCQEEAPYVRRLIRSTAQLDGRDVMISFPQDPGQAGKGQAYDLVSMMAGYVAKAEREDGDKALRAEPFSVQCEAGNIYLVKGDWNKIYVDELCGFPSGKWKDQVDASSGAFLRLTMDEPKYDGSLDWVGVLPPVRMSG